MSITDQPQSKPFTPRVLADHPESHRDFGAGIAMASGALGAAIALVGAALGSLPVLVAAAILLGGWGFLTAANHRGK